MCVIYLDVARRDRLTHYKYLPQRVDSKKLDTLIKRES
jgi:hypothetical protein